MLQEIADVLQAPKRFMWSMIPGLHDPDTGEAYSGSQVAHNAFGTDPEGVWGKLLGFGLDVAGDPLTLASPFIARGVGAAARGLAGLGGVGAAATEAAAPAAAAASEAISPAARSITLPSAITDFTMTPEAIEHARQAAQVPWSPSSISAMRGARDTFGMIKNARPTPEGLEPLMQEALAQGGNGLPRRVVTNPLLDYVGEASGSVPRNVEYFGEMGGLTGGPGPRALSAAGPKIASGEAGGQFFPRENLFPNESPNLTGIGVSTDPITNRHEVAHGIINAIAQGESSSGIPWSLRAPGLLGRTQTPFTRGIGEVMGEAAAQAVESRNPLGQAYNYGKFLLHPHPEYYNDIAQISPLVAALHRGLPYGVGAAGVGALGGGGYYAARPYLGD